MYVRHDFSRPADDDMSDHIQILHIISRSELSKASSDLYGTYQRLQGLYHDVAERDVAYRVCAGTYGALHGLISKIRLIPSGAAYTCGTEMMMSVMNDVDVFLSMYELSVTAISYVTGDTYDDYMSSMLTFMDNVIDTIRAVDCDIEDGTILRGMLEYTEIPDLILRNVHLRVTTHIP